MSAKSSPGCKRVPALAYFAERCDQLVAFETCCVLLASEPEERPRDFVQSLEGVGARAPFSLLLQHRVGGVPLCGLPIAVFSVPGSGGIVRLALPSVRRFAPTRLARIAPDL